MVDIPKAWGLLRVASTPEKAFFLRRPESVLPTSFESLAPSGADDFLADMFSESCSWSTRGEGPVGFLLW